ncbi:hypothetical protein [Rhodococcus sp. 1168]|uniref:hypothetical protein n=1 Tax=Rhodococcus sp. 1168 TaxID=2018041 RepID=UPI000A0B2F43|nr:hypothetical protein [Rhodococcus sp. 1168]ORI13433.1 hypothetical protein BJI47_22580 [Rhodococcus sp. 1168]
MKKLLVRHAAGQTVYDTTIFRTEDKTGVLLVFDDPAQKRLLAAFNAEFWIVAEFVEEADDGEGEVCPET